MSRLFLTAVFTLTVTVTVLLTEQGTAYTIHIHVTDWRQSFKRRPKC